MAYKGVGMDVGFRMDLLVENRVVVEIKSIETILEVHHMQLLTYLKLSGHKLGLLLNFNVPRLKDGIVRKVNGLDDTQLTSAVTSRTTLPHALLPFLAARPAGA
jgi:hypothetical protein